RCHISDIRESVCVSICGFCFAPPRRPSSTLFPYTTLFRSQLLGELVDTSEVEASGLAAVVQHHDPVLFQGPRTGDLDEDGIVVRSEEHTSELQSQSNLVCRLLLEKKKNRGCPPSRSISPSIPRHYQQAATEPSRRHHPS